MSLAEMFRRFVRRESLPVEKQGIYVEGEHDLEKVANMDIFERHELLEQLKQDTAAKKKLAQEAIQEHAKKAHEQREATRLYQESLKAAQNPPTGTKAQEGKAAENPTPSGVVTGRF